MRAPETGHGDALFGTFGYQGIFEVCLYCPELRRWRGYGRGWFCSGCDCSKNIAFGDSALFARSYYLGSV